VRVEIDPSVPMMEIDRGLLRQAVLNLVKNGLEALSSGGELTIASRFDGDTVEISVSDTGGGIPDEVAPRLFEQFFTTKPQAPASASRSRARSWRSTAARSSGRTARPGRGLHDTTADQEGRPCLTPRRC